MPLDIAEIAERCRGTYLGDRADPNFEDLFAEKVIAWHNFDTEKFEFSGADTARNMLAKRDQCRRLMPDFRWEDFELHVGETAFIFVQTNLGTLPDGTKVRIPGCVVWHVEDGKITSIISIGDWKQREPMELALKAMGYEGH